MDGATEKALELVPFTQDLNRELLTVTGLKGNLYEIVIDEGVVAKRRPPNWRKGLIRPMARHAPIQTGLCDSASWVSERALIEGRKLRTFDHVEFLFLADRKTARPKAIAPIPRADSTSSPARTPSGTATALA